MKKYISTLAVMLCCSAGFVQADDDRPIVDASRLKDEKSENSALPTLYLVGDSTVRIGGGNKAMVGWGERIAPLFDAEKINVVNRAIGGRSARTYFTEGRWQTVADALKPGDFVIIQFGHNDGGRVGDPSNKHRADAPGTGDETLPDKMEDGTIEQVHTYGWYLKQFVTSAKAKGATVVICSPIPHKNRWENGRDFADHAGWAKEVADKNGALFMDLTMVITDAYRKLGMEKVETYFADKGTHTNEEGAVFNAKCVVSGLQGLRGNPFKRFLSKEGRTIKAYRN
ncbi:MAG: rhamnogalacturonan acetylesterase [Pontiellaceae bacterium]|nr:rhamnogalacturonan acetylesterase [Pontiellaceae bacterium]MBN2785673.1 rhamnogalacturonan acetylesterase [Pontiellaceae bacterium]